MLNASNYRRTMQSQKLLLLIAITIMTVVWMSKNFLPFDSKSKPCRWVVWHSWVLFCSVVLPCGPVHCRWWTPQPYFNNIRGREMLVPKISSWQSKNSYQVPSSEVFCWLHGNWSRRWKHSNSCRRGLEETHYLGLGNRQIPTNWNCCTLYLLLSSIHVGAEAVSTTSSAKRQTGVFGRLFQKPLLLVLKEESSNCR